jgi:hypothetical protein
VTSSPCWCYRLRGERQREHRGGGPVHRTRTTLPAHGRPRARGE